MKQVIINCVGLYQSIFEISIFTKIIIQTLLINKPLFFLTFELSPDGSYMKFVDCIRNLNENECKQPLHRELCNKRGLKMSSYRYTWKSNIAHDICYRTTPLMDQGKLI